MFGRQINPTKTAPYALPEESEASEGWERDIRRRVVSYAMLAPNPHNVQPWRVKLTGPSALDLYVDPARLLPETDPPYRQVHISQGTFLENLDLAARQFGFRADFTYFPHGMYGPEVLEDKPVASVALVRDARVPRDPLFHQVTARHTNRRVFNRTPLTRGQLDALLSSYDTLEYPLGIAQDRPLREKLAAVLIEAMRIETCAENRNRETIKLFRFNDREVAQHRDGLNLEQMGVTGFTKFMAETFFLSRESALADTSGFCRSAVNYTARQANSAAAFGWMVSASNTRLDQIKVGRAYQRLCLTTAALDLAHQPMSQVLQEYQDMSSLQHELYDILQVPPGQTVQMFFRLGRAPGRSHAPRRPLNDLIVSGRE